jgi:hypothetical protein
MTKMKIWYYTIVKSDDSEDEVFNSYPEEINYKGKRKIIRLVKDNIEITDSDEVEYGEGGE